MLPHAVTLRGRVQVRRLQVCLTSRFQPRRHMIAVGADGYESYVTRSILRESFHRLRVVFRPIHVSVTNRAHLDVEAVQQSKFRVFHAVAAAKVLDNVRRRS